MAIHSSLQRYLSLSLLLVLAVALTTCGLSQGVIKRDTPTLTNTPESERPGGPAAQSAQAGSGTVDVVVWSPDGKIMAIGGSTGIHLYDAETMHVTKHIDTQSWIKSLAFSPDGRTLAAGPGESAYDLGDENEITLWDVDTGRLLRAIDAKDTGLVVAFGPDGHTLATQGYEAVQLWDATTGEHLHRLTEREIVISANLYLAMFEQFDSPLTLWDLNSGKRLHTLEEMEIDIHRVMFSPDGHTLAISTDHQVGESDVIKVFDVESGQLLHILEGPWYSYFLALSPDSRRLAAGGSDDIVQVWDMTTGQPLCTFTEQEYGYSMAFSPDGHTLAVGSDDHTLRLWDTTTCQTTHTFAGLGRINNIAFSPDGHTLVSKEEKTLRLWNVHSEQLLYTFDRSPVEEITLSPDERLFVVRVNSTTVWQWDKTSRQLVLLKTFPGSNATDQDLRPTALDSDGQILATVTDDHTINLWSTHTGESLHTLNGHTGQVTGLAFNPDGTMLASTGVLTFAGSGPAANSDIRLWDTETGVLLSSHETYPRGASVQAFASNHRLLTNWYVPDSCGRGSSASVEMWDVNDLLANPNDAQPIWSGDSGPGPGSMVTLSPRKRIVAAVFQDAGCIARPALIKVWDTKTGDQLVTLSYDDPNEGIGVIFYATAMTFSPDETVLAVGLKNRAIDVWHIGSGDRLNTFEGLTAPAASLVYRLDEQRLASGNQDGNIQLWDTATGLLLHTFKGHTAAVTRLAFSTDGTILASGSQDGSARLWHVDPSSPLPTATSIPNAGTTAAILATQNAQLSTQVAVIETREAIPSLTLTPMPTPAPPALYHPLYLDTPPANALIDFLDPPVGDVSMGDVPFQLSRMIFKSQASTPPYDDYPISLRLKEEVAHAQKVHLLLNTGNGLTGFEGKVVGQVIARCNSVPTVVADLRLGREVREWHEADNVVSTSIHTRQVWSGPIANAPAKTGYIDMLSLDLPAACQEGTLTALEIIDTSVDTVGSLDPALNLIGVTIEYR